MSRIKTLRNKSNNSSVADFPSLEIAKVLTIHESNSFKSIPLIEFFNWIWGKGTREDEAPSIQKLICRFDEVSFWVSTEVIIAGHESKRQKKVVEKFIKIAKVRNTKYNPNSLYLFYKAL